MEKYKSRHCRAETACAVREGGNIFNCFTEGFSGQKGTKIFRIQQHFVQRIEIVEICGRKVVSARRDFL